MPRSVAGQAIKRWFKDHPTTFCPVIGQGVCRHGGCDNADLRADARCDIELKMTMAGRAQSADDGRPALANVRASADGRRYILTFAYDRLTLQDFKAVIPGEDRSYNGETREWSVDRRHYGLLNALFANFADWDLEVGRRRRAAARPDRPDRT